MSVTAPSTGGDALAVVAGAAAAGLAAAPAVADPTGPATELPGEPDAVKHDLAGLDFTTTSPVEPSHSQMRDTWTLPGDLSRIGSEAHEPGQPEPVVEESAVEQVADELAIDAGVIDFELDLGDETPASEPAVEPARADEPSFDLEFDADSAPVPVEGKTDAGMVFDLDIGEPDVAPAAPAAAAPAAADVGDATVLDDFGHLVSTGLDFDLPDLELGSSGERFDLNATVVSNAASPSDQDDADVSAGFAAPTLAAAGNAAARGGARVAGGRPREDQFRQQPARFRLRARRAGRAGNAPARSAGRSRSDFDRPRSRWLSGTLQRTTVKSRRGPRR